MCNHPKRSQIGVEFKTLASRPTFPDINILRKILKNNGLT
jgi:hypothetical protein